ncbi:MAG: 3-oxoacyl-[acyl-carrier-protein] synthase III C-terminal domain-containing protein [Bdellovibrionales bacterium]
MYLSQLRSHRPPHVVRQETALRWLAAAHARAPGENVQACRRDEGRFEKLLGRYGCGPDQIAQRATYLSVFTHLVWESMKIYCSAREPAGLDVRQAFFNEVLLGAVDQLYPEQQPEFQTWIHVTCTGYLSPSVVQTLISQRQWGNRVQCLHAYHMGCYASLPALRMARGNLNCDILHTELCTLHLDPARHDPEQLVIQTLFADGVIRYRVSEERPAEGYQIHAFEEVIASGSLREMTWSVSPHGFQMTLGREVPYLVREGVRALVSRWRDLPCVYAVHPGGPRIIDAVKEALELSEEQVYFSREVLRWHGNMSSATLPHVWERMLAEIPEGTPVISMAFGPGLTLSASLMRKVRG